MENNNYLCNEKASEPMNIRNKIKESGMDIKDVAEALGMSKQNFGQKLSRIENEESSANILLKQIADVLGCQVAELKGAIIPDKITVTINGVEYEYQLVKE